MIEWSTEVRWSCGHDMVHTLYAHTFLMLILFVLHGGKCSYGVGSRNGHRMAHTHTHSHASHGIS